MMRLTRQEYNAILAKQKARKSARRAKRKVVFSGRPIIHSMPELRKRLWKSLSLYVRLRDARVQEGRCLVCNLRMIEDAYHIIPAGESLATKYDPGNLVGACSDCNGKEKFSRRKYAVKHVTLFGKEKMDELERRAARKVKFDRADLVAMIQDVEARLGGLRHGGDTIGHHTVERIKDRTEDRAEVRPLGSGYEDGPSPGDGGTPEIVPKE